MTATAYLLCARIGGREYRARLAGEPLLVGSSADCDFVLPDPTVSRRHARLSVQADSLQIEDLESRNGSLVDGQRVRGQCRFPPQARLQLGEVQLSIEALAAGDVDVGLRVGNGAPATHYVAPDPTQVSAGLTRFCVRDLAPILAQLAQGATLPDLAPRVLNALVANQPGLALELRRVVDGGFLARAGEAGCDGPEFVRDGLRLRSSGQLPEAAFGLDRLADLALSLLLAASRNPPAEGRRARATAAMATAEAPETAHPGLRETYWQAARIGASRLNVLIAGESGTGKELLARYLHEASGEADERFLVLNCAALPADLLDAELFGIEAGVATGVSARAGRFELAHGGSLFLDEIGDMSLDTQARILRVLQEKQVHRVGSHQPRPADVRVISASNRDLTALVREGRFRLDLYHRIADWRAELPPLRARRMDIPNLAAQFLARALTARGLHGAGISQGALDALLRYEWPGNVRELEREMQRAALFLNEGEVLLARMLKPELLAAQEADARDESLATQVEREERRIIARSLALHGGDVAAAAQALGVSKSTLYRRLASLGLSDD